MSEYVTKDEFQTAMREQTDEITGVLHTFMQQVSDRFETVDQKFDEVYKRLDAQDEKYNRLINTIDGFIGRIDKYETELTARDSQFEKLLVWAKKVSDKTGIPLENL